MKKILQVMACGALAAILPAQAQKNCSAADTAAAQKAVDKIVTWANLEKAWRDYGHCDTGPVEDGFTDALMRLMVGWKQVEVIAGSMARDEGYKKFVYKHLLGQGATNDDREDLYALAKKQCPTNQDAFCTELADTVKPVKADALKPLTLEPLKLEPIKPTGK